MQPWSCLRLFALAAALILVTGALAGAQPPGGRAAEAPPRADREATPRIDGDRPRPDVPGADAEPGGRGRGGFGPGGFGPPAGGPGGFGPPGSEEIALVAEFDRDGDKRLDAAERAAARESLASRPEQRGRRGFGGGPGFGRRENREPPTAGPRLSPADVEPSSNADLYDLHVLRTLFLDFDSDNWESELEAFNNTDVEVPATLTVDGVAYPNVGVHFRGMSSFMGVPAGYKRSLNLALDFVDPKQQLYGHRTLNLLNSHGDPSMMSTVLYSHVARQWIAAPKANFVRVVINGEDWGVFVNVQQFNKDFVAENFGASKGARWKVRGNPGADGGLRYLSEDIEPYKQRFEIKSADDEVAWRALIELCRTLEQTPPDSLEAALAPMLDIDGALKFLALDVALVNSDGYWTRASDYSLYRDSEGKFHLVPHDMNEALRAGGRGGMRPRDRGPRGEGPPGEGPAGDVERRDGPRDGGPRRRPLADGDRPAPNRPSFGPPGGAPGFGPPGEGPFGPGPRGSGPPGGFRPPGEGGVELDPLVGLDNPRTPLRSKLLAVPELRQRYLEHLRQIAEQSLDWKQLAPVVADGRALIDDVVKAETRRLDSYEAFLQATSPDAPADGPARERNLRSFIERRRDFLLKKTAEQLAEPVDAADESASRADGSPE